MNFETKWPTILLSKLLSCPLLNGHHQKGMTFGNGFKIVRMVDLYRGNIIDEGSLDRVEYPKKPKEDYALASGDILINRTSLKREGVAKAALVEKFSEPTYFDCSIIRARPNTQLADPKYLLRALNGPAVRPQIMRIAKTATITTVSQPGIRSLQIPLPPLAEQKRIAEILDAADALRQKRRESLAQLDTLLQSTFFDMFGDPVTNLLGWELNTLEELISSDLHSLKRGPFGGALKKEIFVPHGFKVYQQGNVIYDDFELGSYFISDSDYRRLSGFAVQPSDLLISCSGTIGKIAVVPCDALDGVMNQALLKIRLNPTKVLTSFFLALWRSAPFERRVLGMTHGTGMKNMKSMKELKSIRFILPPLELQRRFASIVESVENQKTSQRAHLEELNTLFASLQSRAFQGNL